MRSWSVGMAVLAWVVLAGFGAVASAASGEPAALELTATVGGVVAVMVVVLGFGGRGSTR